MGPTDKVEVETTNNSKAHTKREAEHILTRAGMTRAAARSLLDTFDGKQDAAIITDTQDAVSPELAAIAASFKSDMTSE